MQVTIEEAYAEACRVIGEQIVTQRLLARATTAQESPPRIPCSEAHPDADMYCGPEGHAPAA